MTTASDYAAGLAQATGLLATWLPTTDLTVGMVGRVVHGGFERLSTLEELHGRQPSRVVSLGTTSSSLAITRGFSLDLTAGVGAPGATATGRFSRENAFLFRADGCQSSGFANPLTVQSAIRALAASGVWDSTWLTVTEVCTVTSFTTVVARQAETLVQLALGGESDDSDVSNIVHAGAKVSLLSGDAVIFSTTEAATPLFRAYRLKRGLLGSVGFRVERGLTADDMTTEQATLADIADLYAAPLDTA